MKKIKIILICVFAFFLMAAANTFGQTCGNAITYTSIGYPYDSGQGKLGTKNDDSTRLHWLLTNCTGKIIFDEEEYYINVTLPVYGARILEGSGSNTILSLPSSKIVQTANLPIFKIGTNVYDVAIRDMALIGTPDLRDSEGMDIHTNTIGILAEGGTTGNCVTNPPPPQSPDTGNCSSIGFQFSNLSFSNLNKGIYVNALNNEWQFDNIRLDHARFYGCIIGVWINSLNSGWNISSLDFLIPDGIEQGESESITGKTYGIYLQRSTYTSMDLLIGNGPPPAGQSLATSLIYVKEHANLSIQNSVAEGFHDDIIVHGNSRNSPINLMNNSFLNGVRVKDATLYSFSNQYSAPNNHGSDAIASGVTQIFSMGDKWCVEGDYLNCDEARGFTLNDDARHIFLSTQNGSRSQVPSFISKDIFTSSDPIINQFTSAPALTLLSPNQSSGPLMRIGRGLFYYDITRNEVGGFDAGYLEFQANQAGYGGYSFKTQGGTVTVNYNGSVTFGSVVYSALGAPNDGTMVYCSDCQQTSSCSSGGSGAIAKRIAGSWKCN